MHIPSSNSVPKQPDPDSPLPPSWPEAAAVARWRVDRALDWRHSTLYPLLAKLAYPRIGFGAPISEAEQSAAAESLAKELEFFVTHVLGRGPPLRLWEGASMGLQIPPEVV